jgi:hypothetical protein
MRVTPVLWCNDMLVSLDCDPTVCCCTDTTEKQDTLSLHCRAFVGIRVLTVLSRGLRPSMFFLEFEGKAPVPLHCKDQNSSRFTVTNSSTPRQSMF